MRARGAEQLCLPEERLLNICRAEEALRSQTSNVVIGSLHKLTRRSPGKFIQMLQSFSSYSLHAQKGDFPGSQVVKTLPSKAGGEGSTPGRELRSYMPQGQKTKTQNRSNLVTDSVKTLKMVHIKKHLLIKGELELRLEGKAGLEDLQLHEHHY